MRNINDNKIPIRIFSKSDSEIIPRNPDFAALSMRTFDLNKCYVLKNSVVFDFIFCGMEMMITLRFLRCKLFSDRHSDFSGRILIASRKLIVDGFGSSISMLNEHRGEIFNAFTQFLLSQFHPIENEFGACIMKISLKKDS
jgi:hypothetical protein